MPVDHYENFPVASLLLPRRLRRPIEAIYRFARAADDIADEGEASESERLAALAGFGEELARIDEGLEPERAAFAELAAVIRHWQLPIGPFEDLLDAFAQDVVRKRYADWGELLDYCRRSANPIGRLVLHVFGRASEANMHRSDCICSALQLVNFWQDIAIDWGKGRVYLPQSDLAHFAVSEESIASGACTARWTALLDFEIERTRWLMNQGAALADELPGRLGWEIRLTVEGGLRLLERIRRVRGDVFRQRPVLGSGDWLRIGWRAVRGSRGRMTAR